MTTKLELLATADKFWTIGASARKSLATSLTDDICRQKRTRIQARRGAVFKVFWPLYVFAVIAAVAYAHSQVETAWAGFSAVIAILFVSIVAGALLTFTLTVLGSTGSHLRQYSPLAGTPGCEVALACALACLERSPTFVTQWRTFALQERSELVGLDGEVLVGLDRAERHERAREAAAVAASDIAARLHGRQ